MATQVLRQTALFLPGLLFLVQGRLSWGCPGTVVTYITIPHVEDNCQHIH